MKKSISLLVAFALMLSMCIVPVHAAPQSQIKVLINGTPVNFTADTGYPYIDENNRTMVPLRVTMEAAGCAVGFDNAAKTAIIISPSPFLYRVEVPIGTDYIYDMNDVVQNDTYSVIRNDRTYLPIRVVFESLMYHVEWDAAAKTVDIYNFNYKGLTPFNTGNRAELLRALAAGDVVRIEGEYYATADYLKRTQQILVYDEEDLNIAQLPYVDVAAENAKKAAAEKARQDALAAAEWISEEDLHLYDENLEFGWLFISETFSVDEEADNHLGFRYTPPTIGDGKKAIPIKSLPLSTRHDDELDGVYDGIHIKKIDGVWYFNHADLKAKGVIDK